MTVKLTVKQVLVIVFGRTADEEDEFTVAQANPRLNEDGKLLLRKLSWDVTAGSKSTQQKSLTDVSPNSSCCCDLAVLLS